MSYDNRNKVVIRAHLDHKSVDELKNLLANLLQVADERVVTAFWREVTPGRLNTEQLYYGSPELFFAELRQFAEDVEELKYFDAQVRERYDEYQYYDHHDEEYEFDADSHEGVRHLRRFLREADYYFQARQYDVMSQAYGILQDVIFGDSYELLGIDDLFEVLELSEQVFVQRYFVSLQQSHAKTVFYKEALGFLSWLGRLESRYLPYFFELIGEEQEALAAYLEKWADNLDAQHPHTRLSNAPLHLRLLMNVYREKKQAEKIKAVQHRFRRVYLGLFVPLLARCEAAQDWQRLLDYGQELLPLMPYQKRPAWDRRQS